ncbi:hypothetical protein [Oceanirhabdus sp. W0125-5]|uniref:hypothetical protein n=1 Tax=Oceanirhabdus sp. W0125-5 TaxID=2999116 RepID=UPI0022F2E334|nr:hypothetical protein [Oceanirhabdus sp. W0125-5]WBW98154.1 hypothetical protein OW730_05145 [Oceanirhabdus sp. W0125-5]
MQRRRNLQRKRRKKKSSNPPIDDGLTDQGKRLDEDYENNDQWPSDPGRMVLTVVK